MLLLLNVIQCFNFVITYNLDVTNVIIYKYPTPTQRLSYFGYSVVIHPRANELANSSWSIQIGAPRGDLPPPSTLHEPGAVYRCFNTGRCSIHLLNGKYDIKDDSKTRRNEGWLGVSMALTETQAVTCGHRISYALGRNKLGLSADLSFSVGGCYSEYIESSLVSKLFMPLRDEGRLFVPIERAPKSKAQTPVQLDFDYGIGLAGISVSLTKRGFLLGAPLVQYQTGTFIKCTKDFDCTVADGIRSRNNFYAYYGYSVASGILIRSEEWHAIGAPRSSTMFGNVFFAKFKETGEIKLNDIILKGETYGEYFGASIDVGDINGDGDEDLVVGAPMFSLRSPDQGRVYIFIGKTLEIKHIRDGTSPYGRFGTCVCVAGDLDGDGFKDVIIGAPNENNRGVIYVYGGRPSGVTTSPLQVILAQSIDNGLRGFGISVSRAVDVDSNYYPDILVGAYQSDQAVLIRSRPVVSLTSYITGPENMRRDQTSFSITVCLAYTALQHSPPFCHIDAQLTVDEKFGRAQFDKSKDNVYTFDDIVVNSTAPNCQSLAVDLKVSLLNGTFEEPIRVMLENKLHDPKEEVSAKIVWTNMTNLSPVFPILFGHPEKTYLDVPFLGECGELDICNSKLSLSCYLVNTRNEAFIMGSQKPLLEVSVENSAEPAHNTSLRLSVSGAQASDIKLLDPDCHYHANNSIVSCHMETVRRGPKKSVQFELRGTESSEVLFMAHASTSSNDSGGTQTTCTVPLTVLSDAQVKLFAHTPLATIGMSKQTQQPINFSQIYEIEKTGKSPIASMQFIISIPSYFQSIRFADLNDQQPYVKVDNGVADNETNSVEDFHPRIFFEDTNEPINTLVEKTLFLNCSSPQVTCETYTYPLSPTEKDVSLNFSIALNLKNLDSTLTNYDAIHFTTNGSIVVKHFFRPKSISPAETSVTITKFSFDAAIDIRIIVMSVLIGLFLLCLILPLLVREGFFRRKTKEQMEALKVQDIINQRFSTYQLEDNEES